MVDWIMRFVKGMFIGTGFIMPGISGGALAAVFGIYERMISFLAHLTKEFKKQFLFFFPFVIGALAGTFLMSFVLSYFLGNFEAQILWFFIGCIIGTVPTLWKDAGKKGRKSSHIVIMAIAFVVGLAFLIFGEQIFSGHIPQNFGTWMLAGALIGLGLIVPGLSPSNFLVFMGMYKAMTDGIKGLDFMIIIPVALGGVACVLLFSKLMDYVFSKAYAGLFHAILGVVFASTVMIVPKDFNYLSVGTIICVLACIGGIALSWWMCQLEKKYKTAD